MSLSGLPPALPMICLAIGKMRSCHAPPMDALRRGSLRHPRCRSARLSLQRLLEEYATTSGALNRLLHLRLPAFHNPLQVRFDPIWSPTWASLSPLGSNWMSLSLQKMPPPMVTQVEGRTELSELLWHCPRKPNPTASCGTPRPLSLNQGL